MTKVLFVDDDPIVSMAYKAALEQRGLQVETAADGLAAMRSLREARPDVIVLDILMPRLGGVDVLKMLRSQPELASIPVVVLSNSYLNELVRDTVLAHVAKALLKSSCTVAILLAAIEEALQGKSGADSVPREPAGLLTRSAPPPSADAALAPAAPQTSGEASPGPAADKATAENRANVRRELLARAQLTSAELRNLLQAFMAARSETERSVRLQNLCHRVHFITGMAGVAECHHLAQMSSVLEALLFELHSMPAHLNASVLRTMAMGVDFLVSLFGGVQDFSPAALPQPQALVVDDDRLSNRLVISALRLGHLRARSTDDPLVALRWLGEEHFDLVLLDIFMPGMDGFELCRRIRAMPGYAATPVIYVTAHDEFESRSRTVCEGAVDFIAKPVFPLDLAVKAVILLLKRQLQI